MEENETISNRTVPNWFKRFKGNDLFLEINSRMRQSSVVNYYAFNMLGKGESDCQRLKTFISGRIYWKISNVEYYISEFEKENSFDMPQ